MAHLNSGTICIPISVPFNLISIDASSSIVLQSFYVYGIDYIEYSDKVSKINLEIA